MRKLLVYTLHLSIMVSLFLLGCSKPASTQQPGRTVTDRLGRTVTIPDRVEKIVAIGVGALRLYTYAGSLDKLVGVEQVEHSADPGRPYTQINEALFASLPIIGQGGPNNSPDPERLLNVSPDVIFTTYAANAADADQLQRNIGIPVIALQYGNSFWGEDVRKSLELIGEVTGDLTKAKAASDFIASCYDDLQYRTKDILDKPSVYIGALGFRGAHGIESTQGQFAPFLALNANNVVDETGQTGSVMIDKEKLIEWAPDIMFLDVNGYASVLEDYQSNARYYDSLAPVQNDSVYGMLPYNFLTTNIDTAIVNTYYMGTIIYPEAFADIDALQKADEIYKALLGQEFYQQMVTDFGGFQKLSVGK